MPAQDDSASTPNARAAIAGNARGGLATFLLLGLLTSGIGSLGSVATSKISAVLLGPEGMGILAAIVQVVTLGANAGYLALSPALVAWIAQAKRDDDPARLWRGLGSSLALCVALVGTGEVVVVLGTRAFLPSGWTFDARPLVAVAALGTFATLVQGALRSALVAAADARGITILALVSAASSLLFLSGLTLAFGLTGRVLGIAATGVVSLGTSVFLVRRSLGPRGVRNWFAWDATYLRSTLRVGIPFTFVSFLHLSVPLGVRLAIEHGTSAAESTANVGNYLVALVVGQLYLSLFTEGVSNFVSSRYATARTADELSAELHGVGNFILRIIPPVVFTFIAVRDYAVPLLASSKFQAAAVILGWQVVGDMARLMAWSYIAVLPLRGKVVAHLIVEAFGVVLAITLSSLLIFWIGPPGAGIGYAATYVVQLGVAAWVTARACHVRIAWKQLATTWALSAVAAGLVVVIRYAPLVRWLVLPALVIWIWRSGALRSIAARLAAFRPKRRQNVE